jgi:hypothetical protein
MANETSTTPVTKSVWDRIGAGLARTARVLAGGARWASAHPEVLKIVEGIALSQGAPAAVVGAVETGVKVAGAIDAARRS